MFKIPICCWSPKIITHIRIQDMRTQISTIIINLLFPHFTRSLSVSYSKVLKITNNKEVSLTISFPNCIVLLRFGLNLGKSANMALTDLDFFKEWVYEIN